MKKFYVLSLIVLFGVSLQAEENNFVKKKSLNNDKVIQSGCNPPVAQTDLDISDVRARIITGGDMWWDFVNPKYEVPINSGKTSIYARFVDWRSGRIRKYKNCMPNIPPDRRGFLFGPD